VSGLVVIFDLDGTLVDSKPDLTRSVNHVRALHGLGPLAEEGIASMIGDGARALVARALDEGQSGGRPGPEGPEIDRALQEFLAYYREHMLEETRLYPGVGETLDRLSEHDLAVLTNKPWRFSCLILEGLGIYDRFSAVYGGNSFARKKPDPVGVHRILGDTGRGPETAWMVGDSSVDVRTGRNAGIRTCGVTYGYQASSFERDPPDVRIERFDELPEVLSGPANAGLLGD
jgi:phosphoglycolate phosphatase